jgi:hypothetical protein
MMDFTELQRGDISPLMRHERARSRAQVPGKDVDRDVAWAYFPNGFADGSVPLPFVQVELLSGTAIVYLDKVETPLVEVKVGILLLMAVQADAYPIGIGIPKRTAGIGSGIGVDTGFQTEAMDVVSHIFDAFGETFRMCLQSPFLITVSEETVVDVNVTVAGILQPERYHGFGLLFDKIFADVDTVGVPRTPAHNGWLDGLDGLCFGADGRQEGKGEDAEY